MTQLFTTISLQCAKARVTDMPDRKLISDLLTFDDLPTTAQLINRAETLASLIDAPCGTHVLIGGAPFFMSFLIESLRKREFVPVFAFSKRMVSV